MVWTHQLRRPAEAPRDGSRFMAIKKGSVEPEAFVWDEQMGCFLSYHFTTADALACWWREEDKIAPVIHFVGFRDDRWWNAIKVFGRPHYVHPAWDNRARRDIAPGDTIIFAEGDDTQPLARFNAPDFIEQEPRYETNR